MHWAWPERWRDWTVRWHVEYVGSSTGNGYGRVRVWGDGDAGGVASLFITPAVLRAVFVNQRYLCGWITIECSCCALCQCSAPSRIRVVVVEARGPRSMFSERALLSDKTIKLWKVAERDKRPDGYNLKDDFGCIRDPSVITSLRVPVFQPMELMVEASPKRVFGNAHTYHINSICVSSDQETYLSADDLRVNLWNLEITDQSFSILWRCCEPSFFTCYCCLPLLCVMMCMYVMIVLSLTFFVTQDYVYVYIYILWSWRDWWTSATGMVIGIIFGFETLVSLIIVPVIILNND